METKTVDRTDFLIRKRGFFTGFSSIYSIDPTAEFNTSKSAAEADTKAIRSDWRMIGNDLRKALDKVK
jgi:hypothetical protein